MSLNFSSLRSQAIRSSILEYLFSFFLPFRNQWSISFTLCGNVLPNTSLKIMNLRFLNCWMLFSSVLTLPTSTAGILFICIQERFSCVFRHQIDLIIQWYTISLVRFFLKRTDVEVFFSSLKIKQKRKWIHNDFMSHFSVPVKNNKLQKNMLPLSKRHLAVVSMFFSWSFFFFFSTFHRYISDELNNLADSQFFGTKITFYSTSKFLCYFYDFFWPNLANCNKNYTLKLTSFDFCYLFIFL